MDDATPSGEITPSQRICVLLALTPLLADLVEGILSADPAIRVVGRVDAMPGLDVEETLSLARSTRAQVVLLDLDIGKAHSSAFFDSQPRLKLIAINDDGRAGTACELVPRLTSLGELHREGLVSAIKSAASRSWDQAWTA